MRSKDEIQAWLLARIADYLPVSDTPIGSDDDLRECGLTSVNAVSLSGDLEIWLAKRLAPTTVYEFPTINRLARHLANAEIRMDDLQSAADEAVVAATIAIVGIGIRFPGPVRTAAEFWRLLLKGGSAITTEPAGRFQSPGDGYSNHVIGGFLQSIAEFDRGFFGLLPREAKQMDPHQRLLLEVAWEALEHAGHAREVPRRTGIFVGMMNQYEYAKLQMQNWGLDCVRDPHYLTGTSSSMAAGRLSTFLNASGPSVTIDTACSSSLVAVHLACQSLRFGESDLALVAGVNAFSLRESFVNCQAIGMLSPGGHSVPFDAAAAGMVLGEGCGVVVLKRLDDAIADGHTIYAVIRGSAVNHDGAPHRLLTPNPQAQSAAISDALLAAAREPDDVAYVEAHGASTVLGDTLELQALKDVFAGSNRDAPLLLGSVKANIGHLVGAAGIAGLIKTALSIHNGEIPPHPPAASRAPHPGLSALGAQLATRRPWPLGRRRTAGVSSFGWSGTNAHVIVEEAGFSGVFEEGGRPAHLLIVSARSEAALATASRRLAEHLRSSPECLADVAYTLQVGRREFEYRRAVVCATVEEAIAGLEVTGRWSVTGRSLAELAGVSVSVDAERLRLRCHGDVPAEAARWREGEQAGENEGGLEGLLLAVGRLWLKGARIEWSSLYGGERRRRVALPTYPFERQSYWIETRAEGSPRPASLLSEEPEKRSDMADWFYVPSWKRSFAVEQGNSEGQCWVLLGDGNGIAAGLARCLRERGVQVVRVIAGERFAADGEDRYTIRPGEREDYAAVMEAVRGRGKEAGCIVHLWMAEAAAEWRARGATAVTTALELGFHPLMALAQVLGEQPGHPQRVVMVTSELQDVAGGETLCAEKALVMGPCLVVPQEFTHVRCRIVDVEVSSVALPGFFDRLAGELIRETNTTLVALRGSHRWEQEVSPVRLGSRGGPVLRAGGVYLITGGLGGIGLAMAEHLYRTVGARLVLVGRSANRNDEKLAALRREGAQILVQAADVGEPEAMSGVLAAATERFGSVHGVIHAAGVAPSGLIQRKSRAMAEAVMRPKLQGVLALSAALRNRPLDFLCLFSSMSSMTGGGPGQVDYCAANAFMDAFARQHFAAHGMTFSIGWGEWQWNAWEDGLSGFPAEARQYFIEKRRAFGLSFAEGAEAFTRILRHRIPNTFVATQDFAQMVEGSKNFSVRTILDAVQRMRGPRPTHPRPALVVSYVAPASDAQRRLAHIWEDLLGFSDIGINDNFFDLGGNSLLGVDLVARISHEFQIPAIPAHLLYDAPTIASMTERLLGGSGTTEVVDSRMNRGAARRRSLQRWPMGASDGATSARRKL